MKKIFVVYIGVTAMTLYFSKKSKANSWLKNVFYKEYAETEHSIEATDTMSFKEFLKENNVDIYTEYLDPT